MYYIVLRHRNGFPFTLVFFPPRWGAGFGRNLLVEPCLGLGTVSAGWLARRIYNRHSIHLWPRCSAWRPSIFPAPCSTGSRLLESCVSSRRVLQLWPDQSHISIRIYTKDIIINRTNKTRNVRTLFETNNGIKNCYEYFSN